jgi:hypothetical protein
MRRRIAHEVSRLPINDMATALLTLLTSGVQACSGRLARGATLFRKNPKRFVQFGSSGG